MPKGQLSRAGGAHLLSLPKGVAKRGPPVTPSASMGSGHREMGLKLLLASHQPQTQCGFLGQ